MIPRAGQVGLVQLDTDKDNMKRKKIKINYTGLGKEIAPSDMYFTHLLRQRYDVEISDTPDYLFYGVFGNKHQEYDCIRIFFTGENVVPNFNHCDYAIGFQHIVFEDRYLRYPLWRLYEQAFIRAMKRTSLTRAEALNRKFCNMVVSNGKRTDGVREQFFDALSEVYKQVDSGGRYRNNVGGPVPDKLAFQAGYKFSFAFENMASNGYCTEKILEPFAVNSVPIYYGDKTVTQDFNPKAFINCHDYNSMEDVIERIKQLDKDDNAYLEMLNEPFFIDGKCPEYLSEETLKAFLYAIFDQPLQSARRRGYNKQYQDVNYIDMRTRDITGALKNAPRNWFKRIFK